MPRAADVVRTKAVMTENLALKMEKHMFPVLGKKMNRNDKMKLGFDFGCLGRCSREVDLFLYSSTEITIANEDRPMTERKNV